MALHEYVDVIITGAKTTGARFWLLFDGLWRDTGTWIDEEEWIDGD